MTDADIFNKLYSVETAANDALDSIGKLQLEILSALDKEIKAFGVSAGSSRYAEIMKAKVNVGKVSGLPGYSQITDTIVNDYVAKKNTDNTPWWSVSDYFDHKANGERVFVQNNYEMFVVTKVHQDEYQVVHIGEYGNVSTYTQDYDEVQSLYYRKPDLESFTEILGNMPLSTRTFLELLLTD